MSNGYHLELFYKDILSRQTTLGLILHAGLEKIKRHLVYYKEKVMLVPCRKVRKFCFLQLSYLFRKFWVFVGSFLNIITWEYFTTENNDQCSCCLYEAVWRPKSGWSAREGTLPDTWGFVKLFSRSLPGGLKWICLRGSWAVYIGLDLTGEWYERRVSESSVLFLLPTSQRPHATVISCCHGTGISTPINFIPLGLLENRWGQHGWQWNWSCPWW